MNKSHSIPELTAFNNLFVFYTLLFYFAMYYVASCVPLLVQQNVDGSNFFNRSWAEFKVGFNNTRGNYWLGNDQLHQLTTNGSYKLRFDLQAYNGSWYYAEYSRFIVSSEASNYKMNVSGFSGNVGDAFVISDGMMFTTYDRDNDIHGNNCAAHNSGGFWHRNCVRASVNTRRGYGTSFNWYTGTNLYLKTSRMWLTC